MQTPRLEDAVHRKKLLSSAFDGAVMAAQPEHCLPPHFPPPPQSGRLFCLCAGKAAAAMAEAAERHYDGLIREGRFQGLATVRTGYGKPLSHVEIMEASHPVPDSNSTDAAVRTLDIAHSAQKGDFVLVLLSGGASALWALPADGVGLDDKQALTRAVLKAGATISEINCVRKHLSRIKGGRLAEAAAPAALVTLAISDVPGDAPDAIGSGPTVADPTTLADARAILEKYGINAPQAVAAALSVPRNETVKPDEGALAHAQFVLAATPADALAAAARTVGAEGYEPVMLGDAVEGEARDIAADHAKLALGLLSQGKRAALISGGELTVTIRGGGRGGPNQEYALALALALDGAPGICALAADTDGSDGGTGQADDPAGAFVLPDTLARAKAFGENPAALLAKNDSTRFFEVLKDLLVTGPTFTNVNDLRVILVDPETR